MARRYGRDAMPEHDDPETEAVLRVLELIGDKVDPDTLTEIRTVLKNALGGRRIFDDSLNGDATLEANSGLPSARQYQGGPDEETLNFIRSKLTAADWKTYGDMLRRVTGDMPPARPGRPTPGGAPLPAQDEALRSRREASFGLRNPQAGRVRTSLW